MNKPYEITGYVGHNGRATEFVAKYNNEDVTLKMQHGIRSQKDELAERSRKEFEFLTRLIGIEGIPIPIRTQYGLSGTYEQLGFASCGKPLEEAVPMEYYLQIGIEPYFSGGFLRQLTKNGKKIDQNNKQSPRFFGRLEVIVGKVHGVGLSLPVGFEVLEVKGRPYIEDWQLAAYLPEDEPLRENEIKIARLNLDQFRLNHQRVDR